MIQIVIHTLPYEIDQLEQTLIQLKRNSVKFEYSQDKFLVDVILNLNLVDWSKSKLDKNYFLNKFSNLEKLTQTWAKTQFVVDENQQILGCVSHRRKAFNETTADAIILLDTDIIFSDNLLYYFYYGVESLKEIENNFILCPQIPKGWDNSWDCLVNKNYLNRDDREYITRDPYQYGKTLEEVSINKISNFKFGGGWATLISTPLTKLIPIPESLGHYGLEDTYIMECAQKLKQKGIPVNQYVMNNELICEDHIFRFNNYKPYLHLINRQEEFRQIAYNNYSKEIKKFVSNLENQK